MADIPWQEFFVNPQLQKLIGLALANNRDLRVAALNIERSRAQYQIQRADLFPKVDASASATYQRLAEDFSGTGLPMDLHQYNVGLGVSSYELDLFGRVRSLKDQALQQFFATGTGPAQRADQPGRRGCRKLPDLGRRPRAAETGQGHPDSQQTSYQLIRRRYRAGVSSALDLHQAQTSVDTARVDIARYTTSWPRMKTP